MKCRNKKVRAVMKGKGIVKAREGIGNSVLGARDVDNLKLSVKRK